MSRRSNKNKYQVSQNLKSGLDFPDLLIKLSGGMTRALHVNAGEFLPAELLDEKDIALSEHSGCIFRSLKAGWLVDVTKPAAPKVEIKKPTEADTAPSQNNYKLVEVVNPEEFARLRDKTGTVSIMETNGPQPSVQVEMIKFNGSMPIMKEDTNAVVSNKHGGVSIVQPEVRKNPEEVLKSNISKIQESAKVSNDINSFQEFAKLTHYAKLDYIKFATNVTLLKEVVEHSEVKQLVNNANGRLRELGITA